jgi:hypothetical protein
MQLPLTDFDTAFNHVLQELPLDIVASAKDFDALVRARKVKDHSDLLRLIFLYSGVDLSLREVAANFTLLNEKITDQAVANRLKGCLAWLKAMVSKMYKVVPAELNLAWRLVVVDASHCSMPTKGGEQYRIHLAINLETLEIIELEATPISKGEKLSNFEFQATDLVIADAGYCRTEQMIDCIAELLLRVSPGNCLLYSETGEKIVLAQEVEGLAECCYKSIEGYLKVRGKEGKEKSRRVRVIIYRMTEAEAEKARRRKKKKRKGSKQIRPETIYLAGFVIVITTLGEEVIRAEEVLQIYRCRWQVEIVIKRFKSILNVDKMRSRKGVMAEVWLQGKMLYVLIIMRRSRELERRIGEEIKIREEEEERELTSWRIIKMEKARIDEQIRGIREWEEKRMKQSIEVLKERRRKRKLQVVPIEIRRRIKEMEIEDKEMRKAA